MKTKKTPMRLCIGCRNMFPKRELIRVVQNKEGKVSIDLSGKAQGRGAYLCRNAECMTKAIKSRSLHKAFDMPFDDDVLMDLKKELGG